MKKQIFTGIAVLMLSLSVAFIGYAQESALFEGWAGSWKSSYMMSEDPAMTPAYETVAEKTNGKTAEEVKAFMGSMYKSDFGAMDVQGETITYYELDGTTVKATCEYKSEGKESTTFTNKDGSKHEFSWYMFSLKTENEACEDYKHLIMTQVHGHEGSLEHWHMRYGKEDLNELMNHPDAMWWPTLIQADITIQDFVENTLKNAEQMASMF
jgi:Zn/Cd-binding protein ZinT